MKDSNTMPNPSQLTTLNISKQFHLLDSPEVVFKMSEVVYKHNVSNRISSFYNENQTQAKRNYKTISCDRNKYIRIKNKIFNIMEQLNQSNITLSEVMLYKDEIFNNFLQQFIIDIKHECRQKGEILEYICQSLFNTILMVMKVLARQAINEQKQHLNTAICTHETYQQTVCKLRQKLQQKTLELAIKDKFSQNLFFTLRFKCKQVRKLYKFMQKCNSKLKDYNQIYFQEIIQANQKVFQDKKKPNQKKNNNKFKVLNRDKFDSQKQKLVQQQLQQQQELQQQQQNMKYKEMTKIENAFKQEYYKYENQKEISQIQKSIDLQKIMQQKGFLDLRSQQDEIDRNININKNKQIKKYYYNLIDSCAQTSKISIRQQNTLINKSISTEMQLKKYHQASTQTKNMKELKQQKLQLISQTNNVLVKTKKYIRYSINRSKMKSKDKYNEERILNNNDKIESKKILRIQKKQNLIEKELNQNNKNNNKIIDDIKINKQNNISIKSSIKNKNKKYKLSTVTMNQNKQNQIKKQFQNNNQNEKIQSKEQDQNQQITKNINIKEKQDFNNNLQFFKDKKNIDIFSEWRTNQTSQIIINPSQQIKRSSSRPSTNNKKQINYYNNNDENFQQQYQLSKDKITMLLYLTNKKIFQEKKQKKIQFNHLYNKKQDSNFQKNNNFIRAKIDYTIGQYFLQLTNKQQNYYRQNIQLFIKPLKKDFYKTIQTSNIKHNFKNSKLKSLSKTVNNIFRSAFEIINKKGQLQSLIVPLFKIFDLQFGIFRKKELYAKILNFLTEIYLYRHQCRAFESFLYFLGLSDDKVLSPSIINNYITLYLTLIRKLAINIIEPFNIQNLYTNPIIMMQVAQQILKQQNFNFQIISSVLTKISDSLLNNFFIQKNEIFDYDVQYCKDYKLDVFKCCDLITQSIIKKAEQIKNSYNFVIEKFIVQDNRICNKFISFLVEIQFHHKKKQMQNLLEINEILQQNQNNEKYKNSLTHQQLITYILRVNLNTFHNHYLSVLNKFQLNEIQFTKIIHEITPFIDIIIKKQEEFEIANYYDQELNKILLLRTVERFTSQLLEQIIGINLTLLYSCLVIMNQKL